MEKKSYMLGAQITCRHKAGNTNFPRFIHTCLCSLCTFPAAASFESLGHSCSHTFHFVYTFPSTFDAHDTHNSVFCSVRGSVIPCSRWISQNQQFSMFVVENLSNGKSSEVSRYSYDKDRCGEMFAHPKNYSPTNSLPFQMAHK